MTTFIKQNKVLMLVVTLFVFGIVYYTFFVSKGSTTTLLSTGATLGDQTQQSQQLLVVLANLRTIQLNDAIFSDPTYLSLTDFSVAITPETVGRHNPFLPFTFTGTTTQQKIVVPIKQQGAATRSVVQYAQ